MFGVAFSNDNITSIVVDDYSVESLHSISSQLDKIVVDNPSANIVGIFAGIKKDFDTINNYSPYYTVKSYFLKHGLAIQAVTIEGNQYAQFFLDRMDSLKPTSVMLSTTRLLHHMSRIFQDNSLPKSSPVGMQIDRKRLQKLRQKKPNLRPNTVRNYANVLEQHIIPAVGSIKLRQSHYVSVSQNGNVLESGCPWAGTQKAAEKRQHRHCRALS